jgi:hypothetical protein
MVHKNPLKIESPSRKTPYNHIANIVSVRDTGHQSAIRMMQTNAKTVASLVTMQKIVGARRKPRDRIRRGTKGNKKGKRNRKKREM